MITRKFNLSFNIYEILKMVLLNELQYVYIIYCLNNNNNQLTEQFLKIPAQIIKSKNKRIYNIHDKKLYIFLLLIIELNYYIPEIFLNNILITGKDYVSCLNNYAKLIDNKIYMDHFKYM